MDIIRTGASPGALGSGSTLLEISYAKGKPGEAGAQHGILKGSQPWLGVRIT